MACGEILGMGAVSEPPYNLSQRLKSGGISLWKTRYHIASIYGIFTYIWPKFIVNAGRYIIHGSYGYDSDVKTSMSLDLFKVIFYVLPW